MRAWRAAHRPKHLFVTMVQEVPQVERSQVMANTADTEEELLRSWDEELANWRERGIDRSMRGDGSDVVPPEAIASVVDEGNWLIVMLKDGNVFMLVKAVIRKPVVTAEYVRQELTKRGVDWSVFNDLPTAAMKGTGNA